MYPTSVSEVLVCTGDVVVAGDILVRIIGSETTIYAQHTGVVDIARNEKNVFIDVVNDEGSFLDFVAYID